MVRDDESSARPQAFANFPQRAKPLVSFEKVQHKQTSRTIVRSGRRGIDSAVMQFHSLKRWSQKPTRQIEHFEGGINAHETPSLLGLGECFKFKATTGPEYQNVCRFRRMLRKEKHHHAMKICKAWNFSRRGFQVARDHRRIIEGLHQFHGSAKYERVVDERTCRHTIGDGPTDAVRGPRDVPGGIHTGKGGHLVGAGADNGAERAVVGFDTELVGERAR